MLAVTHNNLSLIIDHFIRKYLSSLININGLIIRMLKVVSTRVELR